jgi:hypothetical protein
MTNLPNNAGLKALAEAARMRAEPCTPAYSVKVKAFSAFQAAASPDRILALIARNEALEGALRQIADYKPLGDTGIKRDSYQRGYDQGFANAGGYAAFIARATLQPSDSRENGDG